MHIKTTKCSRYCLVASTAPPELFDRPDAQSVPPAPLCLSVRAGWDQGPAVLILRGIRPSALRQVVSSQYFRSFRRVRISFQDALAAAEARLRLHKTDLNGREMRLYFAQSVHIGGPRLEPPKPDKQFLISPPASPPVGWEQSPDARPVVNYDLLCAIAKLGPGMQRHRRGLTQG
ncbi:unnamed protein product [Boreogadus saida]